MKGLRLRVFGVRHLWERVCMYLPALLMGGLALGTYWLAKNPPAQLTLVSATPMAHEFDYFMRKFGIKTFDAAGQLKNEVAGLYVRHFPGADTLAIDQARIRAYSPEGRLTTTTADQALSNGDGSEMQLLGHAHIVREAQGPGAALSQLEFRGEFLHVFLNAERVQSHLPVTLIRGADQFTANQFAYDNADRVAVLTGRVKGVLVPRQK